MGFDEGSAFAEGQRVMKEANSSKNHHVEKLNGTGSNGDLYTVKLIPDRGFGCVATSRIPKGTRILTEAPLFTVPKAAADIQAVEEALLKELKSLSKDQQHSFFSLHNAHKGKCSPVIGITKTNAIPFGSGGADGGIFPRAARINHSCKQNAQNTWNHNLSKLTIHAFKDIEEGEEITISYVDGAETFNTRQLCLEEAFGFVCQCELCSLSAEENKKRDNRLEEMARLDSMLGNGRRIMSKPLDCLHDAHTILRMLNEEGIVGSRISRVYNDALQISIAHSDQARAKVFAQRAHDVRVILEGEDSPETMRLKRLIDSPTSHGLYGSSKEWAQPATAIPQGLDEADFEDWLWRQNRWQKELRVNGKLQN
ncbi:uncharacterized protein CIMG_05086 [Coccidioides immitis RS]|uniref:SET domain-containing protein n=4 Tax=Coccidioides immitis TaxID=5501 RepID=A0A0E1S3P6_COCIM|nr:uncharacterized protein CIMG_05086 [Coccidioides immitis RS]KMP05282.1 hypothetical protein CIRG_04963 [Coccidioides immitis RMSCC 2394]KMU77813.1 hypothetical protein CISG_01569 [Coccidioides immitis RMSCC 3703]KMU85741.1 hypothetical protein CIHG_03781 [Coccidioides immitis H538.4]TPX21649.1 hypothetical protein DIZ76_015608 [Coccidioides immitis]EAS34062.1 hypothetical protein CIMG_05086 [Coccidioides immitis RS]